MTNNSEWQEANRRLMAEQREKLGEPPSADEMLAYSRGELSESEEERIRDLLVAYPELARMYSAPMAEEPKPGVSDEEIDAGLNDVRRRIGGATVVPHRAAVQRYVPTTIAAALALVFFGLYLHAENRARNHERGCQVPRILGAAQELEPDGNRGSGAPTPLRGDGEVYLLKPRLINQIHYGQYNIELRDETGVLWTRPADAPEKDAFQVEIPYSFLRPGGRYQLRIFGVDGGASKQVGSYDVAVPWE